MDSFNIYMLSAAREFQFLICSVS